MFGDQVTPNCWLVKAICQATITMGFQATVKASCQAAETIIDVIQKLLVK